MDFPKIKEHLGEEWLNKELEIINNQKWVEKQEERDGRYLSAGLFLLNEINSLISKFEKVNGFKIWVEEARTSKHFGDCLFELMSIDVFFIKSDSIELKKENGNKIPEAFVKKENLSFFLECTRLKDLPTLMENKIHDLFKKSSHKFRNSEGIHLIGTFGFFDDNKPNKYFRLLRLNIEKKFERGMGSTVIAFIITNFYIVFNPKTKLPSLNKGYWLIINPNKEKKYNKSFFENLLDVEKFGVWEEI
jgi:hypothetical protein